MKLKDDAIARFFDRCPQPPCGSCGAADWTYERALYELREHHGGGLTIGADNAARPVLAVTCGRCGNVKLYDAVVAGLLDAEGNPLD